MQASVFNDSLRNHELFTAEDAILPKRWYPHRPHKLQSKLWYSCDRFPVVVAGRGSGKTECARRFITRMLPVKKPWDDPKYVYALPTYQQAERIVWPDIESLIPPSWIAKNGKNKSSLTIKTKFGSTLFIVGMDKPSRIEGIQVDGVIYDESSDQKPDGFDLTILPMLTHRRGFCWRIGVPKRAGVGAASFKKAFDQGIRGEGGYVSYTWPSDSVLTPDQLFEILQKLDKKDAEEQLGGIWVDIGGGIYYAFDEKYNVTPEAEYIPEMPIGIGSDFNVNPMAWVLFHVMGDGRGGGKMHVFDEIWLENCNTQMALNYLYEKYGKTHQHGFQFFGDASAANRHTSSSSSDLIQIMNDKRFHHPRTREAHGVNYPSSNPPILDRYAAVNALCCNGLDQRRLFINPRCTKLREDLSSRTFKKDKNKRTIMEPDNSNPEAGHISDALGYPIALLFPVAIETPQPPKAHVGPAT